MSKRKSKSAESTKARSLSTDERRRKRVELAIANPIAFGEIYISPYDENWTGPLPRVAREALIFARFVKRGVIWTPPEFLKTTVVSQVYPLWLTYRYAQLDRLGLLTGMLLSEEQKLAERNLSVVAWHVEHNAGLAADFVDAAGKPLVEPDADEDKWTDQEIVVRRPGKVKDPTWQAKGLEAKGIQGSRLRHLIGDDVITPRSAESPATQEKARRLWDEQITTRVLEDGQAIIAGNYNGPRDLLASLAAKARYHVFRRPAIHKPGKPHESADIDDPEGVLALPERFDRARLQSERAEKPNRFRRIYLLDSTAEAGERLKVAWLQVIAPDDTPIAASRWYMALDPAPGGDSDDLDFFNITVAAAHEARDGSHLDIAVSHDFRASTGDAVEMVAAYHDRFNRVGVGVQAIGVAKVAIDKYFGGALEIFRKDLRPKLVPIGISEASKAERIEALGPYARSGWLRIWDGTVSALTSGALDEHQELAFSEQWRDFPNISHDDKLDGADVVCRTAIEFGAKAKERVVTIGG